MTERTDEQRINEIIEPFYSRADATALDELKIKFADFILADRKRVLDEVEKPLNEAKEEVQYNGCWEPDDSVPTHRAIDEALQTITRLKGE